MTLEKEQVIQVSEDDYRQCWKAQDELKKNLKVSIT